eukprot:Rmarinus@m.20524
MGTTVNASARLMDKINRLHFPEELNRALGKSWKDGGILCDESTASEVLRTRGSQQWFLPIAKYTLKGFKQRIQCYAPLGRWLWSRLIDAPCLAHAYATLVGRRSQLDAFKHILQSKARSFLCILSGSSGNGRTHLIKCAGHLFGQAGYFLLCYFGGVCCREGAPALLHVLQSTAKARDRHDAIAAFEERCQVNAPTLRKCLVESSTRASSDALKHFVQRATKVENVLSPGGKKWSVLHSHFRYRFKNDENIRCLASKKIDLLLAVLVTVGLIENTDDVAPLEVDANIQSTSSVAEDCLIALCVLLFCNGDSIALLFDGYIALNPGIQLMIRELAKEKLTLRVFLTTEASIESCMRKFFCDSEVVVVPPLTRDELDEFIRFRLNSPALDSHLLDSLFAMTLGNVLAVEEILSVLCAHEGLVLVNGVLCLKKTDFLRKLRAPRFMQYAFEKRIASLDPVLLFLLKVASVLGSDINVSTLRKIFPPDLGIVPSQLHLDALCKAGLLVKESTEDQLFGLLDHEKHAVASIRSPRTNMPQTPASRAFSPSNFFRMALSPVIRLSPRKTDATTDIVFRFQYDSLRRVCYNQLAPSQRSELHARIAFSQLLQLYERNCDFGDEDIRANWMFAARHWRASARHHRENDKEKKGLKQFAAILCNLQCGMQNLEQGCCEAAVAVEAFCNACSIFREPELVAFTRCVLKFPIYGKQSLLVSPKLGERGTVLDPQCVARFYEDALSDMVGWTVLGVWGTWGPDAVEPFLNSHSLHMCPNSRPKTCKSCALRVIWNVLLQGFVVPPRLRGCHNSRELRQCRRQDSRAALRVFSLFSKPTLLQDLVTPVMKKVLPSCAAVLTPTQPALSPCSSSNTPPTLLLQTGLHASRAKHLSPAFFKHDTSPNLLNHATPVAIPVPSQEKLVSNCDSPSYKKVRSVTDPGWIPRTANLFLATPSSGAVEDAKYCLEYTVPTTVERLSFKWSHKHVRICVSCSTFVIPSILVGIFSAVHSPKSTILTISQVLEHASSVVHGEHFWSLSKLDQSPPLTGHDHICISTLHDPEWQSLGVSVAHANKDAFVCGSSSPSVAYVKSLHQLMSPKCSVIDQRRRLYSPHIRQSPKRFSSPREDCDCEDAKHHVRFDDPWEQYILSKARECILRSSRSPSLLFSLLEPSAYIHDTVVWKIIVTHWIAFFQSLNLEEPHDLDCDAAVAVTVVGSVKKIPSWKVFLGHYKDMKWMCPSTSSQPQAWVGIEGKKHKLDFFQVHEKIRTLYRRSFFGYSVESEVDALLATLPDLTGTIRHLLDSLSAQLGLISLIVSLKKKMFDDVLFGEPNDDVAAGWQTLLHAAIRSASVQGLPVYVEKHSSDSCSSEKSKERVCWCCTGGWDYDGTMGWFGLWVLCQAAVLLRDYRLGQYLVSRWRSISLHTGSAFLLPECFRYAAVFSRIDSFNLRLRQCQDVPLIGSVVSESYTYGVAAYLVATELSYPLLRFRALTFLRDLLSDRCVFSVEVLPIGMSRTFGPPQDLRVDQPLIDMSVAELLGWRLEPPAHTFSFLSEFRLPSGRFLSEAVSGSLFQILDFDFESLLRDDEICWQHFCQYHCQL